MRVGSIDTEDKLLRRQRRVWIATLILLPGLGSAAVVADEIGEPERIVREAKARAVTIPEQARALAALAWPAGGVTDPEVSALARDQLIGFGDRGLEALHERLLAADPRFSADITAAIIRTRLMVSAGLPPQYIPAVYDAVWYGSIDAKRLAMDELGRRRYAPGLLPIIDAVYEYPQLTLPAIRSLVRMGNDRARHYLGLVLMQADPRYLQPAADALATIGGRAMETLREGTASTDERIRGASIDALLPLSGVDDLTILYEYIAQFGDDDPQRMERVLQRATQLESMLEALHADEAASGSDDF